LLSVTCHFFDGLLASHSKDYLLPEVQELALVDAVDKTLVSSVKLLILEAFKDKDPFFSSSLINLTLT
jgi:hypothetical protein